MHGGMILEMGIITSPLGNGLTAIRTALRNVTVLIKMDGCMKIPLPLTDIRLMKMGLGRLITLYKLKVRI